MGIVIGTRRSQLSRIEANGICDQLRRIYPDLQVSVKVIELAADLEAETHLEPTLYEEGKAIEEALSQGMIDLAVQPLEEMPLVIPEALQLIGVPTREDAREALILKEGYSRLEELPFGAKIAFNHRRQQDQLLAFRPDFNMINIYGSIQSRLKQMKDQVLDGMIFSAATLHRLGLRKGITEYLPMEVMLPAPMQGAIGIEVRKEDQRVKGVLEPLEDAISTIQVRAERSFLQALDKASHWPIGAYCEVEGTHLRLRGLLGDLAGERLVMQELSASVGLEEQLGRELARKLERELDRWAKTLVDSTSS